MREKNIKNHPCFNDEAKGKFARVHLPVAPKCNIQCNFCDRRYNCINESRPGVTSVILSPGQALAYLGRAMVKIPDISVVGIAGPGDPLANPDETLTTLQLVKEKYPQLLLCVATNGLNLPDYADQLIKLQVSHVTVTVNAIDEDVGGKIYAWVRLDKKIYHGKEAFKALHARQIEGIKKLKSAGMIVKINSIIIPGVNDRHIPEVAKKLSTLGVDIFNAMPLIPSKGTEFAEIPEPDRYMIERVRSECEKYLPQMRHCNRCRADSAGILGHAMSIGVLDDLKECAAMPLNPGENRQFVAVATLEGVLVNEHLGKSEEFAIYALGAAGDYRLIEKRAAAPMGLGDLRWQKLAEILKDCRAVLVSAAGAKPVGILRSLGLDVIEMDGLIEQGLDYVFKKRELPGRRMKKGCGCGKEASPTACEKSGCADGCSGSGTGCM